MFGGLSQNELLVMVNDWKAVHEIGHTNQYGCITCNTHVKIRFRTEMLNVIGIDLYG